MPSHNGNSVPDIYIADHHQADTAQVLDCDCGACVEQVGMKISTPSLFGDNRKESARWRNALFTVSDQLFISPLDAHASMLDLNHGTFLVLNNAGYRLLKEFDSPARIRDVVRKQDAVSARASESFCAALHKFGILRSLEHEQARAEIKADADTLIAWIHLTDQCNLRCQYCYIHKSSRQMTEHVAQQALERLFVLAVARGCKHLKLKYAGGEPTLHTERLMQMHCLAEEFSEKYQIEVEGNILTNGVAIPEQLLEFSLRHDMKWAVSLDGVGERHDRQRPLENGLGSSARIMASIDKLCQSGCSPHIPITVTRENLAELPALVELLSARQLRFSINFYRQNRHSLNRSGLYPDKHALIETLHKTYRVIEKNLPAHSLLSLLLDRVNFKSPHLYPCAAGRNYLVLDPEGNLAPCQMLVSSCERAALGDGFKNMAVTEKERCRDCSWQKFCAGGCPLEAYHAYGRFDAPSPYCEVYRTMAPQVLRLEALRLLKDISPLNYMNLG